MSNHFNTEADKLAASIWQTIDPGQSDCARNLLADLLDHLRSFVTAHKQDRMTEVLNQRTRHITVVLEDIFQPHNGSAAVRSCECFGVQEVHIIENRFEYRVNPDVVLGASKWLDLKRYNGQSMDNTGRCIAHLKSQGYRIAGTVLRDDSVPLSQLPVEEKLAICFGTEESGLSDGFMEHVDSFVKIPMHGFTQSFNISVSVALCLYDLTTRLRRDVPNWGLCQAEKEEILLRWLIRHIPRPEPIIKRFLGEHSMENLSNSKHAG